MPCCDVCGRVLPGRIEREPVPDLPNTVVRCNVCQLTHAYPWPIVVWFWARSMCVTGVVPQHWITIAEATAKRLGKTEGQLLEEARAITNPWELECAIHGFEPASSSFRVCGECHHAYRSAEELVWRDFEVRVEVAKAFGEEWKSLEPCAVDDIHVCPYCTHDF